MCFFKKLLFDTGLMKSTLLTGKIHEGADYSTVSFRSASKHHSRLAAKVEERLCLEGPFVLLSTCACCLGGVVFLKKEIVAYTKLVSPLLHATLLDVVVSYTDS